MKNLSFVFTLMLLWSCGNKNGNGKVGSFDFSIEIDTVLVDSKGEILMAGAHLHVFELSNDKKFPISLCGADEALHLEELAVQIPLGWCVLDCC